MYTESTPDHLKAMAVRQPLVPVPWQVRSLQRETYDTFTLALTPPDGTPPLAFAPGQFNMLYVFGVGEVPISISGDPAKPEMLVHTARAVGAVTKAMSDLKRGQVVGVRGPYGTAWPVLEARGRDVVIAAGGIGLPPLRPALYYILAHRDEYGRVAVLYGARAPHDILFARELERWRGRFDLEVEVTVDTAPSDWRGNVGLVTMLIPKVQVEPPNTVAMIVGPEIMMRFVVLELEKLGVRSENIFISMERNMKCAVGYCGHCQFGPTFVCKDGPVFRYDRLAWLLGKREI
jgi:NAD(P)H-flavin reductase